MHQSGVELCKNLQQWLLQRTLIINWGRQLQVWGYVLYDSCVILVIKVQYCCNIATILQQYCNDITLLLHYFCVNQIKGTVRNFTFTAFTILKQYCIYNTVTILHLQYCYNIERILYTILYHLCICKIWPILLMQCLYNIAKTILYQYCSNRRPQNFWKKRNFCNILTILFLQYCYNISQKKTSYEQILLQYINNIVFAIL